MKAYPHLWIVICLLGLAALGCDLGTLPAAGQPASPVDQQGMVLFQDDFSDPASGWATQRSHDHLMDYENGAFRIWVNQTDFDVWSVPGLRFTDVSMEVNAASVGGPVDNDYGLICRYKDANNFYGFLISSDGYYGISKRKDGNHQLLGQDGMLPGKSIQTGTAENRIRADCLGTTLALYVNGTRLAEVQDSDFSVGDVGLLAGSFAQSGVDILFDNLVVRQP